MKTVKKLLSLMLVAMLLVTAIPFQASATGFEYTLVQNGKEYTCESYESQLTEKDLEEELRDEPDVEAFDAFFEDVKYIDVSGNNVKIDIDNWTVTPKSAVVYSNNSNGSSSNDNGSVGGIQVIRPSETPKEEDKNDTPAVVVPVETPKEDEKNDTPVATAATKTIPIVIFDGPKVGEIVCNEDSIPADVYKAADYLFDNATNANFTSGKKSDYNVYSYFNGQLIVKRKDGGLEGTGNSGFGEAAKKFTVQVKTDGGTVSLSATEGTTYSKLLAGIGEGYGKKITGYRSENKGLLSGNELVDGNDTVTILYETVAYSLTLDNNRKGTEYSYRVKRVYIGQAVGDLPTPVAPDGYVFVGWKLNGKYITKDTIWELPGDATAYAEYKLANDKNQPITGTGTAQDGKVYLEIYTNDNTKSVAKRVDITKYADDNKITQAEAEKVIRSYFTAKSGYSLKMIGLFDENGWWWYTRDDETKGQKEIVVNRDGDDYVYVMVNNVKTSTADTSNPKTGDSIVSTLAGLGLSASMLAALCYIIGKKRLF